MNRTFLRTVVAAGAVAGVLACADAPTAPVSPLQSSASSAAQWRDYSGHGSPYSSTAALVQCERHPAYSWSGEIGPRGGSIRLGNSLVIVPSGALSQTVRITATIPEGENLMIRFDFEPSGLVFRKPAGLIFDASGCNISEWYAPDIVHINDAGEILEYLPSYYSNYWHVVAAPIWHFSGFAVAW
jgi:hypothetical protein